MKTADVSDATTRGWDVHTCCWLRVRSYYCFNFYFKYVWLPMNICPCLYCTTMCVSTCVCPCVNSGSIDSGQEHLKKKKVNTDLCSAISSRGYSKAKRKLWGKKRDGQKKETDFKMCSKEKQTQGFLLFSLLFGFFLCSYRKEQNDCGVQLQVKGDGLLNRPQHFYRFPWRTSDLWEGRMGAQIKEEGLLGEQE